MQEVKNFSTGVLSNGGAIERAQDREAKRERERIEKEAKEAEDQRLAEAAAKRIRIREERAIEMAEQSRARKAAEEEKQRKDAEKVARDEEERRKVVAAKEAARLARQQDLERRLAENKERETTKQAAKEAAALLAKQQTQERQNQKKTQAAALLDDLSKSPAPPKVAASKPVAVAEDLEDLDELEEPVLQIVKGEVHVPASMPAMDASESTKTELPGAYDMSALMPAPAVLTVDSALEQEAQVESGKELIDRLLADTKKAPEDQEQVPQSARSENRFQKIINTNRDLAKENEALKERVEKLLDEVHGYKVEGELVGSIMDTKERSKREAPEKNALERHLKPDLFNVVDEAKQEMLKYLSTRQDEVDHTHKSVLFLKYMQDPFYMSMFVQNNQASQWWPMIDSIYNSIEMLPSDWSKMKMTTYQPKPSPQPIRARTATLGAPVASSEQPMDRIAQHLGNMGI